MADSPIGVTFMPSPENQTLGPQNAQANGPGGDLSEAFKILSLHLPRVLGPSALASSRLLTNKGSAGLPSGFNPTAAVFQALIQSMIGSPSVQPPSAGPAPFTPMPFPPTPGLPTPTTPSPTPRATPPTGGNPFAPSPREAMPKPPMANVPGPTITFGGGDPTAGSGNALPELPTSSFPSFPSDPVDRSGRNRFA